MRGGGDLGAALDHLAVVVEVAVVIEAPELQIAILLVVAILLGLVVANAIRLAFSSTPITKAAAATPPTRSEVLVLGLLLSRVASDSRSAGTVAYEAMIFLLPARRGVSQMCNLSLTCLQTGPACARCL